MCTNVMCVASTCVHSTCCTAAAKPSKLPVASLRATFASAGAPDAAADRDARRGAPLRRRAHGLLHMCAAPPLKRSSARARSLTSLELVPAKGRSVGRSSSSELAPVLTTVDDQLTCLFNA
eukprot:1987497-Pleurochrysis_carterae.AAC.1